MIRTCGPTGRLIQGHVLDVNKRAFEETLRFYDKQLYAKWNPKKLGGWGCWEIRRKPEQKSIIGYSKYKNKYLLQIDYKEYDIIHHVLDMAYLNYDALRKLKEMDTWTDEYYKYGVSGLEHQIDAAKEKHDAIKQARAEQERQYILKHNKKIFQQMETLVQSGINPARLLTDTNNQWVYKHRK